jgi:hypothetical protein
MSLHFCFVHHLLIILVYFQEETELIKYFRIPNKSPEFVLF